MTPLKLDLARLLTNAAGETSLLAPATVDIQQMLDFNAIGTSAVDLDQLLAGQYAIATVWSVDDVRQMRPDLTHHQAWAVLLFCQRTYDCEVGITLPVLKRAAFTLFGEEPPFDVTPST